MWREAKGKRQEARGILHRASCILHLAGCDSPQLDAELLLAHALGRERTWLLAHPEYPLTATEEERFAALLARRQAREPLAYILGHREFYGLDFIVDHRVLVPRPETEMLVEQALAWARRERPDSKGEGTRNALSPDPYGQVSDLPLLADVGTGSGCVAVALAAHLPQAVVYALDASADALAVAAANAARHGVAGRVQLLCGDLLEPLPERVDVIVANLPYVRRDELPTLPPEIRDYEPRAALDGGPEGLDWIGRLLAQAPAHLRPGGIILLEIGAAQGEAASGLARQRFPQAAVDVLPDYAGRDRVLRVQT
ncbi:MAG: peptide chain release factor N(5)-glutamine methyltransferase [Anaerolineae bacterium]|nr:peptide chain release factor N(5)-glutamine methyltransferase [Anaerolineae bacterium]